MNKIKQFSVYAPGDYYVANEDALTKITISKVYITAGCTTYETDKCESYGETGGAQIKLYKSEADFKAGQVANRGCRSVGNTFVNLKGCSDNYFKLCVDDEGFVYIAPYIWKDNDAHQVTIYPERFVIGAKPRIYDLKAMVGEEYAEMWADRQTAIESNDYIVQEQDGTQTVRKSAYRHALLTPKQWELANALKEAWKNLQKSGVCIFVDNEHDRVYMYNTAEVDIDVESDGIEIDITRLENITLPCVSGYCDVTYDQWVANFKS